MDISIITRIVELEWEMFQNVRSIGPASCQGDRQTFEIMRRSQFESWADELNKSYLFNLEMANAEGRNLLTEKYAYMMEFTHPSEFEAIAPTLPAVPLEIKVLANSFAKQMADSQASLSLRFPHVARQGRPIYSIEDSAVATSIETYWRGELQTYSPKTLLLLGQAVQRTNMAHVILLNTIKKYGFRSLEEAEDFFQKSQNKKQHSLP